MNKLSKIKIGPDNVLLVALSLVVFAGLRRAGASVIFSVLPGSLVFLVGSLLVWRRHQFWHHHQ